MAFTSLSKPAVGTPTMKSWADNVADDLDYLDSKIDVLQAQGVLNGSFEVDSDGDGQPDSWERTLYPNGSGGLFLTDGASGKASYRFVHPGGSGNGGGYIVSDYIEISRKGFYDLEWSIYTAVAHNKVEIKFYDKDKALLSTTVAYESSSDSFAYWRMISYGFTRANDIPLNAQYIKVLLYGGISDYDPGASATIKYDAVRLIQHNSVSNDSVGTYAVFGRALTEQYTSEITYTKLKEFAVGIAGSLLLDFELKTQTTGGTAYAKIYVNGSAVGPEFTETGTGYAGKTASVSVKHGDLVQIYCKRAAYASATYIQNVVMSGYIGGTPGAVTLD